jgi:transposase-like protein
MKKGTPVPQPVKDSIMDRVKKGESVDDLASEFDLYPNTIRRWLRQSSNESGDGWDQSKKKQSKSPPSLGLQISKLQKEKQQLLEIIGELTLLTQQSKKKVGRSLFG